MSSRLAAEMLKNKMSHIFPIGSGRLICRYVFTEKERKCRPIFIHSI